MSLSEPHVCELFVFCSSVLIRGGRAVGALRCCAGGLRGAMPATDAALIVRGRLALGSGGWQTRLRFLGCAQPDFYECGHFRRGPEQEAAAR